MVFSVHIKIQRKDRIGFVLFYIALGFSCLIVSNRQTVFIDMLLRSIHNSNMKSTYCLQPSENYW
jgi:hypothetical protein